MKMMRRGFTLAELLVVLAVLFILTGLTLAALRSAKAKARLAQCSHNLRENGIALQNFVSQNSAYPLKVNTGAMTNRYPEHGRSFYASLAKSGLGAIPDGAATESIYICPSGEALQHGVTVDGAALSAWYGYNADGLEGRGFPSTGLGGVLDEKSETVRPVHESEVLSPSRMIAMGDGIAGWNQILWDSSWTFARTRAVQGIRGVEDGAGAIRSRRRHSSRANAVFCDGHLETIPFHALYEDTNAEALIHWNRDAQPHPERLN